MSKAEKNAPSANAEAVAALEEIREMIVGPPGRELEARIAELSRQVAQMTADRARDEKKWELLQSELAEQGKKSVRRAARHRALTTTKINNLAQQIDRLTGRLKTERQNRLALAEAVAALSRRRRAVPRVYKIRKTAVADYRQRQRRLGARQKKKILKTK